MFRRQRNSTIDGIRLGQVAGRPRARRTALAISSRDFLKGAGLLSSIVILGATFGVPLAARASTLRGATRLIDTHRVVGIPQQTMVATKEQASRSGPPSRGRAVAPTITSQPSSETVAAGATASFSAAASGSPTPSVQWEVSTNAGRTWTAIRQATSTTYSLTASSSQNGDEYEAVFTNSAGKVTTDAATLTVTTPSPSAPTITSEPSSETVAAGSTASFSAAASGSPIPSVQWQVSTNAGATWTTIGGATSTTYSFTASSSQNGDEYEAVFTNSAGIATTAPATLTVTVAPVQSSNWSGYADSGATFRAVSASWTVPTVTCQSRANAYSAQWIGIDGYASSTVEQDGTEADCLAGSASYDAWYEMYGDSAVNSGDEVELSPSTNPVSPGDVISASVGVAGSTWTLAITDSSTTHTGWTYSTNIGFSAPAESSAEWVVERPEICSRTCSLASLADFGSVSFSNASTTTATGSNGPISSNSDTAMEMVNGATLLAVPGALGPGGAGFTDTWEAS